MDKNEVKENLQKAYVLLLDCHVAIWELNQNGHQFDYCTDSRLSDVVDKIVSRAKSISKIVYQEGK